MHEGVENGLYVLVGMLLGVCGTIIFAALAMGGRTDAAARRMVEEDDNDVDRREWRRPRMTVM